MQELVSAARKTGKGLGFFAALGDLWPLDGRQIQCVRKSDLARSIDAAQLSTRSVSSISMVSGECIRVVS